MEIHQPAEELDPSEYVSSLNGLTGDVVLAAGTNISLVPVGNTITINATDTDTGITELTGDVTAGPGSGSQVATLATVNSNVGSFTNASLTVNAKGLVTAASSGVAPVTSVSGTLNRITSTGGTTPVIDISASYVGQSSITTLGTITTGVWNGTAIANANLANSSITIGSTAISLGASSTTLAGLTSVTSTTFVGALTGNASTATALATGRTIAITGDLAYTSGSFDGTGNVTGTGTLASIISAGGPTGSATVAPIITYDAKGRLTAVSSATITPAVGSITGLGTGVATALAINVGTAGAFLPNNGAGTSLTGIPYTITGTANQVIASAGTGNITLSLPQSIATTSAVTFGTLALGSSTAVLDDGFNGGIQTLFANSGQFLMTEYSLIGTNDIFFQLNPVTNAGYGILEAGNGSSLVVGTSETAPIIFRPNRAEAARLNATKVFKLAGTATRGTTEGTNHLDIFNGTAPVGTLTNGNSVYSTSGILQAMDAAGNNSFVADVRKYGRATAQTGAVATVATYTTIADNSFEISANVLVTTSTTHNFTVTCAYTDEGNTARTLTVMFSSLAGGVVTAIANAAGAVPYAGIPVHIRAKSATAITIATTGTFTTVTYNVEGIIRQIQ